ncbi:MAG: hypothetical protein K2X03_04470 [Bryobacteraceae bacterium]|nr:hypothetical protein [Bryobacteraceae bacterium]
MAKKILLAILLAFAANGQTRSVIILPAGTAVDPRNRQATILDADSWRLLGKPSVGPDAFGAFITVLGDLAQDGTVRRSLDLPEAITGAALTPDGKRLLVVSSSDPSVRVINTQNDQIMARIPLAQPGNSVAISFDQQHFCGASVGSG